MKKAILLLPENPDLEAVLKGKAEWEYLGAAKVPSLVSFASALNDPVTIISTPGNWSPQHMAAAAKILRLKGSLLILYGKRPYSMEKDISLLPITEEVGKIPEIMEHPPELVKLVKSPTTKEPEKDIPKGVLNFADAAEEAKKRPLVSPSPKDGVFLVNVAESQTGVGGDIQALMIYHYLKSLGEVPAIWATQEKIDEWSAQGATYTVQSGRVIAINGVNTVVQIRKTSPEDPEPLQGLSDKNFQDDIYNCYIRICGSVTADNSHAFLHEADLSVLVCSTRTPEDIKDTVMATAAVEAQGVAQAEVALLMVNCTKEQAAVLGASYPRTIGFVPKDPWETPDATALAPVKELLEASLKRKFQSRTYDRERGIEKYG